jgi:hypothetical protein
MSVERDERDVDALATGYATSHRVYEICGMIATGTVGSWLLVRILSAAHVSGWWLPLAALVGILASDFASGFVHWMFDTWGSVDTPVVGRLAIRTFRHHHVDAKAITRHDFIETNGHNVSLSLLPVTVGVFLVRPESATLLEVFIGMALLSLAVFNGFTGQIHKWAHTDSPPRLVRLLQRARLVISPDHHSPHHSAPYTRSYCITVGWLNAPLRAVRFFETLERIITWMTGAIPREDDLGAEQARLVAAAQLCDSHDTGESEEAETALAVRD